MRIRISPKKTVQGVAFPEYVRSEGKPYRKNFDPQSREPGMREFLLPILAIAAFGLLFFRLFNLQVIKGVYYRNISDENRIRTTVIHAPRGIIFDRNGVPLVYNVPGFRKMVSGKTILLSKEEAMPLIATGEKSIDVDTHRQYPYKDTFAHMLGYIGQITKEELKTPEFSDYQPGDLLGKIGIEREYEKILRGKDGKELLEIDATGRVVRTLGQTDPIPGQNITVTIDQKLQQVAYNAMAGEKKGAVIVATPKGEVLALVSKTSFDPNLFTLGKRYVSATDSAYKDIGSILTDSENQPFLNRAIAGVYPPGSTFKLITAAAGLDNSVIDDTYKVADTGMLQVGAFSFGNWYFTQYGKTEGDVNVVKAIKRSNDIFFYKLAEKIGVEKLSEKAASFGLGDRLGIDLGGEEEGLVPTDAWKKKAMGEGWYLGDTYHYGIGQGYLLVTPLQVNGWTQVIANGGILYQPHLLKNQESRIKNKNLLSEKTRDLIRQGMVESCSPGGVAWPLFEFRIKNKALRIDGKNFLEVPQATTSAQFNDYRHVAIACKTGTAQHGGEETLPHAWITLFAPAYDPQIVLTVLAESSGEGSNVAAPIAKKILEEWFSRQ